MEDADVRWEIQGHSDSKESNGKVSWLLNTGLWLGKKAVIAGVIVSSAPLVLPPLLVFTTLGLACSVPFGLVFASYACTEKLMSKLLPSPSSFSLILESENEELKDSEDKKGQSQPSFRKKVIMEDEEEEEVNETVNGVVMRIEFNNEEKNEFEVWDILRPDSEQNPLEMRVQKPVDKAGGVVAMGNEIEDKDSDVHQQRDFGRDDSDIGQSGVQEEHEKCPPVEDDHTEEMIEGSAVSMESDPNIISEFEGLNIVKYVMDDIKTCVETPEEKGMEKEEQLDYIRSGVPRRTDLDETSTQGSGKRTDLDFGQNGVQVEHEKCPSVEDRTEEMIEGSAISMESDPNIISEFERLDLVKYCVDENRKCVETLEERCLEKEEQMDYVRSGVPRRTDLDETYLDETSTEEVGKRIELDFGQDDIDFGQNGVQEEHEKFQSVEEDQIEDIMEGSAISMESDPKIISEVEQLELTEVVRNELGVDLLQDDVDYRLNSVEKNKEKPVGVVNNTIISRGCEDFSEDSQGEAKWKLEECASKNKVPTIEQERYKELLSEVRQVMVVVGRDTKNERKQGIEELKESEKVVLVAKRVFKETDEGNVVVQEDEEPVNERTEEIQVKEGRYVQKVIGTDDSTTVGTLSADFECVKHEIENISDYSNGRVDEKNHRVLLETIVEEQKKVPQIEMVSNAPRKDLATLKKKTLIHLNSELRETADECGLDLLDDMNTYEYSYTVSDNPSGDNESNELLVSAGEPESNCTELVALSDTEIHYKEEQLHEEKIWEKIDALRAIVGYKAVKQSSTVEELKALYVFTGVEPPTSSDELSDIMKVDEKLQLLMLIIGVK